MSGTEGITIKSTLKAHDKLLFDVIKRQAGSLEKAITEGTMNSIEAGTPKIIIKMWQGNIPEQGGRPQAFLRIEDTGEGIKTEREIALHFETFGQPHEANENIKYKQFRMGRGQMFAFGRNIWRTSQFKMEVDINKMGLTYNLTKGLEQFDGCVIDIELYENPIGDWQCRSIEALRESVAEQVRYVDVPVMFNDKQISIDPVTLNWDFEDDDAYYSFNDASVLKIYNLGIYVKNINKSDAGVGGVIVSKRQLKVNFARNDVQSDCPVFKRIREIVQENKLKIITKKYRALSTGERYSLLRDLRDGAVKFDVLAGKRIFRTAQGKWYSWNMIIKSAAPWTFAPEGDMKADKAMQMGQALCFSQSMLDELCYDDKKDCFFDWIMQEQLRYDDDKSNYEQNIHEWYKKKILEELSRKRVSYLCYDKSDKVAQEMLPTLSSQFDESYQIFQPKECIASEKRILSVLNESCNDVWRNRRICLGASTVASAWTDGRSYVVLDRNWLKRLSLNKDGDILQLFGMLAHEMAHDDNTAGTHIHGPEFYEKYYILTHNKKYYQNPLFFCFMFKKSMLNSNIEAKKRKEAEKEAERNEKLGIANTDTVAANIK